MKANSAVPLKDQKLKPTFLVEVNNIENQLWALIHSKGLLHPDVRDLYGKAGSTYEKIFLSNLKHEELQDIEYSLWKLHYKHIDEFRKKIKTNSANSDSKSSLVAHSDGLIEEFKSFLSRATEFYQNLIVKIRSYYGASEEFSLHKWSGVATSAEHKEIQKFKFLCHRFFVCLGDLARYTEQYQKTVDEKHNWSAAVTHYLEATKLWPDSGNPHNQLAVLATYVGDEFLALYHCVRSLAVKEPFPDAWNNLILLFEKNRSNHLPSLHFDVEFDFLKASKRSNDDFLNQSTSRVEKDCTSAELWPLVVRTMGFFFLKSSLDDFNHVFASTMRELDAMLETYDRNPKLMLESNQLVDSARTGPFRTLQLVSILIFIFHHLTVIPNTKELSDDGIVEQQDVLKHLGLAAAFFFMGRLVETCLKTSSLSSCPLLPAVLVFVEYLPFVLDEAEKCGFDDWSSSAMIYFFDALVNLLNQLTFDNIESSSSQQTALWEDLELRGFAPVASSHTSLDFSSYQDHGYNFDIGIEARVTRIKNAALKIADREKGSKKWVFFDTWGRQFYTACMNVTAEAKEGISGENGKYDATDEEEVILFKPLTRYNSAEPGSAKTVEDQMIPSDECLRRATSQLIAQNPVDSDASDFSNFRFNKASKQPGSPSKESFSDGPISAGPPSLSAWVISGDNEKERRDFKHELSPIGEITSGSFSNYFSNHESADSAQSLYSAGSYSPPIPSAPLVPEDASWFPCTDKVENFYGGFRKIGATENGLLDYGLPIQDFMNGYPNLPFCGISSSEWLRRYREHHQNLRPANFTHAYPAQANLRDFLAHDSSRLGLLDRYGTPSEPANYTKNPRMYPGFDHFYMGDEHQRTKPFDLREDPRPLLQYLKNKEWLIRHDQHLRGPPTYTGNQH